MKLREWQESRVKETKQQYEDDNRIDDEDKCDWKPESDTIEDCESEIMTIHLADNKAVGNLKKKNFIYSNIS